MSVNFKIENDVLTMTIIGKLSFKDTLLARTESSKLQKQHDFQWILVDVRAAQIDLSTIELFDFCTSFRESFPAGTKHIVLYSLENHTLSNLEFVENVTDNRGIFMKMVTNIDEAKEMIKNDKNTA